MQKKRLPLLLALFALVILGGLFYAIYESKKPQYEWDEGTWKRVGYSEKSPQPYGTQVMRRLLGTYFDQHACTDITEKLVESLPLDSSGKASNYVFIGEAMYLDSASTRHLLQYVAAGNTAFICSKTIPLDLMTFVYFEECVAAPWNDYDTFSDTTAALSLRSPLLNPPSIPYFYARQNQPEDYRWHYIESRYFCDSLPAYPLGYVADKHINFAVFPHGKGRFLLHTNPIAFSNFSLLRPESRPYTLGVLSHLQSGDIYWDAMSRIPEGAGREQNGDFSSNRGLPEEHPFTYILQQPALAWAWYILVGMAVVGLIFRAKRRHRILPVLPKNENSSYEFISTISHLHFQEKNYRGLSNQAMRHFLAQLRERYDLAAPIDPETGVPRADAAFFDKLALRSEVPTEHARSIFTQYAQTVQFEPTEKMATDLYLAMEGYLKAGK